MNTNSQMIAQHTIEYLPQKNAIAKVIIYSIYIHTYIHNINIYVSM